MDPREQKDLVTIHMPLEPHNTESDDEKPIRITPCDHINIWARGVSYGFLAAIPVTGATALLGWIGGLIAAQYQSPCISISKKT